MTETIEKSLAKLECLQLLSQATYLMDHGKWNELAQCYKEDAILVHPKDPDNPIHGREAIVAKLKSRPPSTAVHFAGNSIITILGDNKATGASRVFLVKGPASDSFPVKSNGKLLAGTYYDKYEKVKETWYIAERRGVIEVVHE